MDIVEKTIEITATTNTQLQPSCLYDRRQKGTYYGAVVTKYKI